MTYIESTNQTHKFENKTTDVVDHFWENSFKFSSRISISIESKFDNYQKSVQKYVKLHYARVKNFSFKSTWTNA